MIHGAMKRPAESDQNQSDAEVPLQRRPLSIKTYSLDDLVKKITPANRHDEIDFGPPVGRELL